MKIAIIGTGNIAPFYIRAFENKAEEIILCSRTKPKTYRKLKHYCDYKNKNILKCDLVIITTPPYLHLEMTKYFLKQGKKVIVEKPAIINQSHLKELAKLAKNKNVYFAYHSAFNPIVLKVKEIIRGSLRIKNIKIQYYEDVYSYHPNVDDWIFNKELSGGGCLIDSGINIFSILYQFIPKVSIIKGTYKTMSSDIEYFVNLALEAKSNINVNISMNWKSKKERRVIEFSGKDNIRFNLSANTLSINNKSVDLEKKIKTIDMQSEYDNMISDAIDYFKYKKTSLTFNPLLPLGTVFDIYDSSKWFKTNKVKAIIVSAGGVSVNRTLPEYVKARLEKGIEIHNSNANTRTMFILTGRETLYKPPVLDQKGFPVIESELMAKYLIKRGIPKQNIRIEKFSNDSLGGAVFSKIFLIDPLKIKDIIIISSSFHIKRLKEIYNWVFNLSALKYNLKFVSTPNDGVKANILLARKNKEKNDIERIKKLEERIRNENELFLWLFSEHAGYSVGLEADKIDKKNLRTY
ncbi:Gfo/Idh/MocA family oxidoreductase [Patescibacteria group bacterium]|nr:Gfo/Idh/MocA family oxidoreductase [Patescibacteria group bacterium]